MKVLSSYYCAGCKFKGCIIVNGGSPQEIAEAVILHHNKVSAACCDPNITLISGYELLELSELYPPHFVDTGPLEFDDWPPCDCPDCQAGANITISIVEPNAFEKSFSQWEAAALTNRHPLYYPVPSNN